MAQTLILGFGNTLMGDDGIGVRAIERLREAAPPDLDLAEGGTSALDAIDWLAGRNRLILIDAVRGGRAPGTIYRFTPAELRTPAKLALSLHSISLPEAMRLWELQLEAMPEIVIFGVEPSATEWGTGLSAPVAAALPEVCRLALAEARR